MNEERFKYYDLPKIYSNFKRIRGDTNFSKATPRRELFDIPNLTINY